MFMLVFLFYFSHTALKMLRFCVLSTNLKLIEAVFKNSSKVLKAKYIEKQKAEKYSLKFEFLFASNFLGLFLKSLKSTYYVIPRK
jgi:hypothetical protein